MLMITEHLMAAVKLLTISERNDVFTRLCILFQRVILGTKLSGGGNLLHTDPIILNIISATY